MGGTTGECASLLRNELNNHDVTLLEIGRDSIDLDEYDFIAVGFPIRMGKPFKSARRFLAENSETLSKKRVGYFLLCGFVDCFEEYAESAIPKDLRDGAVAVSCFGGSLDPSRFKGFDRLIVKMVRSDILGGGDNADQRRDMSLPTIMEPNIVQFADLIKNIG
jgi:menaquinone-dependent protoporphyrinogen oxidase